MVFVVFLVRWLCICGILVWGCSCLVLFLVWGCLVVMGDVVVGVFWGEFVIV